MADSQITKNALANSLKSQMQTTPFKKISVEKICAQCSMNRKSFYYHFKDKYDLINWIFDTEFYALVKSKEFSDEWELLRIFCNYLYDNRSFYKKAFKIEGQNSFRSHITETTRNMLETEIFAKSTLNDSVEFQITFLCDGFVCTTERWITSNDPIAPELFLSQIQEVISKIAKKYYDNY